MSAKRRPRSRKSTSSDQHRQGVAKAYRRGKAFLARRRRLPDVAAALSSATAMRGPRLPYAFGRDPRGRQLADRMAAEDGTDANAIKRDVLLTLAVDAILVNCGKRFRPMIFSGRLDREQIEKISRVHPDRQRAALARAARGLAALGKSKGEVPVFDTVYWGEVRSRLERAEGLVRKAIVSATLPGSSRLGEPVMQKAAAALAKMAIANERLAIGLAQQGAFVRPKRLGRSVRARIDSLPKNGVLQRPHTFLAAAAGFVEKNIRDLPRFGSEVKPTAEEINRISQLVTTIRQHVVNAGGHLPMDECLSVHRRGKLTFIGDESRQGSYVLRIAVREEIKLAFGRFKRGKLIAVPAGEYIYVGSARGQASTCLARRLCRHATRLGDGAPHAIRATMARAFMAVGICDYDPLPVNGKKSHWTVDHLLDRDQVVLKGAVVIRSQQEIEKPPGKILELDPGTAIIEKGLGASDVPGNTHLLRVIAGPAWWTSLPYRVLALLGAT